ncbi:PIN-like domain-containing protein [Mucilaginibacter auburnensis]|uniref:PIN like domain-containing protein n=1 Tax=Mucilaginibacter auburnensis TaxID=1457233 RepID=A0A2H9VV06_9SPHI|nr:PIN-like domain-containing protein [Mucilaginibacter auburnensis]PJJ84641.1 hypothetical protein CLV57_1657 [Mucilaginibacter auburnensis]
MKSEPTAIKEISFGQHVRYLTIDSYIDSLSKYRTAVDNAIALKTDIPIFLDTNILLRYYSVSFKSREVLLGFFSQNDKRFYITSQVQKEFVKNREDVIDRFFNETLDKFGDDLKTDVINKIQAYKDRNKILLDDFQSLDGKLTKIYNDANKSFEQLNKEITTIKQKNQATKYDDDLLSIVTDMNLIDNLSEDDLKFLQLEYDGLKKGIDLGKIKMEIGKPQKAFPGMADLIEKPEHPYGDYFIFHEIIRVMKENQTDAIFLTYDTTKGDWLKTNKEPHSHYIQTVYRATGHTLFFLDAERFFDQHLKQHFESLLKGPIDYYSPKSGYEEEFILNFVALERVTRTIAEFVVIDNYDRIPLTRIIDEFEKRNYINKQVWSEFKQLSQFKNLLTHVHDRDKIDTINPDEFAVWVNRLDAMITMMKDLYRRL